MTESRWQKHISQRAEKDVQNLVTGWLHIGGVVGCGKTHICTATCGEVLKHNMNVSYMCWAEGSVCLKIKLREDENNSVSQEYKDCDVLNIDDFKV